jgi:hypothetical protein
VEDLIMGDLKFAGSTGYFRGLYAQAEGNESRSDAEIKQEKIDEFNKAEGAHVKRLTELFQIGHYGDYKRYCQMLKDQGYKQHRIDAIVRASTYKVKLSECEEPKFKFNRKLTKSIACILATGNNDRAANAHRERMAAIFGE